MRKFLGWLVAAAILALAGPSFAGKTFYAELVDAAGAPLNVVPNGVGVTIRIKIYNTSDEPATLNSLLLCKPSGVTIKNPISPGTLKPYTPTSTSSIQCEGWTITDFTGIRRQRTAIFTVTADVNTSCSFTTSATWKIGANTGNSYPGGSEFINQFDTTAYFGCSGPLACPSITSQGYISQVTEFGNVKIYRGENKNLSAYVPTPYQATDFRTTLYTGEPCDTTACQGFKFEWNSTLQRTASYRYLIPWELDQVGTNGVPDKQIYVRWGTMTTPVLARYCLADTLPFQVGTLGEDLAAVAANTADTITVTATAPPPNVEFPTPPFAISIGPDTSVERMLVTAIAGNQWSVLRGNGGTPAPVHLTGAKLVINPLPLDAAGIQMQMCVAKHKTFVVGAETCTSDTTNQTACSVYGAETEVLDYGDGWVLVR